MKAGERAGDVDEDDDFPILRLQTCEKWLEPAALSPILTGYMTCRALTDPDWVYERERQAIMMLLAG
ncbi:hypothetical protein CBR_g21036 [Chara braunii]|uniref:Uncharacterized protein n=1 Tax=Chara braunii TaxID=69332 RepID=A0A388L0F1_CHABU|nr:hypothetical protein CBR_g21036 [Chara braunii]|eukprot:GBG75790.1 hypothetical protein CBR_g21036 [Chara braunii]